MKRCFILIILILIPWSAHALVSISEIAWMGTPVSPNDEWLELYNDEGSSVSLTGWTLVAGDGTPAITLSGSIDGNGYFLLERTDDITVPDVVADQIFTGALGNEGETLLLKNDAGATIDTVSAAGGWPAGDATNHETMQLVGNSWITARSTPRTANIGSGDEEDVGDSGIEDEDETSDGTDNESSSSRTETVIQVDPDPVYVASMIAPDFAVRGVAAHFESMVTKDSISHTIRGRYKWSMGDGTGYVFEKSTPINHVYEYPGVYTVVFQYYSNDLKEKPDSIHKKIITVIEDTISLAALDSKGGVTLSNATNKEVDLGGWKISQGQTMYSIPEFTYIKPKGKFIIPSRLTQFQSNVPTSLLNPNGDLIGIYPKIVSPHPSHFSEGEGVRISSDRTLAPARMIRSDRSLGEVDDQMIRQAQAASVIGSGISLPNLETSLFLFGILVVVAIAGYSVYVYGFPKRTKFDTEAFGKTPSSAEYDLDDILRGS